MRHTANYSYYETGALKRVELADGIQGIDYVYNLQGQLKAINHPNLTKSDDPGGDDSDLFGMTLDYYSGDYVRYNRFSQLGSNQRVAVDQFNGNIKGITWNTKQGTTIESPLQYLYAYDRNNWLKSAQFIERDKKYPSIPSNLVLEKPEKTKTIIKASESITLKPGFTATANSSYGLRLVVSDPKSDYKVSNITYDANGNIQTLMRNKDSENDNNRMDDLTYVYDTHKPNRLLQVVDAVTATTNADDIKTQPKYNYYYNSIGQLYYNRQEGLWYAYNAAGLVTDVRKNGVPLVHFNYNDRGQRVKKLSYVNGKVQTTTHYVRDVAGAVMAIYENKTLTEHPIYGTSRLGVYKRKSKTSLYQLTDHLGNVRAVIAKKGSNAAALVAKTDYYPFGMPMPNRNVEGDYRYKFQGQEKDKETGMEAFEARLWDSRIGRWLTVDPAGEFYSPYLGMGNNPISTIDPDGRCTECPENAKIGDTYMHSEYGEVTYSKNGWGNDSSGIILNDVFLGVNEMTPFDVGVEWLTGTGPIHRDFFAGDTFTEMIKTHSHVKDTKDIIGRKFANGQELLGVHRYRLNGIKGVGKYVKDYSTLLTAGQTGNLAVTYLGTYSLEYSISDVDVANRTMRIHFTVHNESDMESATRPPVIGYEPIWTEGPGKWINSAFQTGPMSPKTQAIHWSSTIKY